MSDFVDCDDPDEDDVVTCLFERLDVPTGPGRWVVNTLHRSDYARHFRELRARFPVSLLKIDPRRSDHPDRIAEDIALRERIHAIRLKRAV